MAEVEPIYSITGKRIFVAGHRGMVGSALVRRLAGEQCEILTAPRIELDLRRQADTEAWMLVKRPDIVFLAAARVGGIFANDSYPAEFLYDNLMIEANLIRAAHETGVEKLLFLGSSCIYPRLAPQPPRRTPCSPARSSRPTNGMPLRRLPGSSSARRTGASTATTSSRRCRRIYMVPATTIANGRVTCCRP